MTGKKRKAGTARGQAASGGGAEDADLPPAAHRALAEAAQRRKKREAATRKPSPEKGGRKGPDPVRYGDWEKDGIISDF